MTVSKMDVVESEPYMQPRTISISGQSSCIVSAPVSVLGILMMILGKH